MPALLLFAVIAAGGLAVRAWMDAIRQTRIATARQLAAHSDLEGELARPPELTAVLRAEACAA